MWRSGRWAGRGGGREGVGRSTQAVESGVRAGGTGEERKDEGAGWAGLAWSPGKVSVQAARW